MFQDKKAVIGNFTASDTFILVVALECSSGLGVSGGKLHFSESTLALEANEAGIALSNIQGVRIDLECGNRTETSWPSVIERAKIYGLNGTTFESNFAAVDLCDITSDEYFIKYFVD